VFIGAPSVANLSVVTKAEYPSSQHDPDLLAGAVLNSLTRPLYYPLAWDVLPTFIAAALTGGVLPTMMIPKWLKGIIAQHQQQLWHLAEWLRLQGNDPQVVKLQNSTRQIHYNIPLALPPLLFSLIALVTAIITLESNALNFNSLYALVFTFPQSPEGIVFTLSVIAGAVCNWVHLAWHQRNMNRWITDFNNIAPRIAVEPVPVPRFVVGVRPLWLLAGIALSASGAIWPIPVMLAGAAHRRYTLVASVKLRAALGQRLRTILNNRRPPLRMPRPMPTVIRACIRPSCRASLPVDAAFCPRCGTRAVSAVDVVA
jgi:hypothetical protein